MWEDWAIVKERGQSLDPHVVGNVPQKIRKPIDPRPAGASASCPTGHREGEHGAECQSRHVH